MKQIKSSSIFRVFLILFFVVGSAYSTFSQSNDNSNQAKQAPQNKRLKIKKKPHPTAEGCKEKGSFDMSGLTIVKVTFDKSAKVTDVVLISQSGCRKFDESAIDAAKRIKFEPEIKDGEPITVVKRVQYAFSIY